MRKRLKFRYSKSLRLVFILLAWSFSGCAQLSFVEPEIFCERDGLKFHVGLGGIAAGDNCNTCFCNKFGELTCTQFLCPAEEFDSRFITNSAEHKCLQDFFTYETQGDAKGNLLGFCRDQFGQVCLAWDYFRGDCLLGEQSQQLVAELRWDLTGEKIGEVAIERRANSYEVFARIQLLEGDLELSLLRIEPWARVYLGSFLATEGEFGLTLEQSRAEVWQDFDKVILEQTGVGVERRIASGVLQFVE